MQLWKQSYDNWKNFANLDSKLKKQLNNMSKDEIKEAFYQNLSFGTGGLRGILGPGTDRMNIYTVRKSARGLGEYLKKNNPKEKVSVTIAYDSRHMSREFAIECAKVFGYLNIHTYIFPSLRPTPLLSFAVRHLRTSAGIMITASHNPPQYNGLKVYNEDGGQLPLEPSKAVIEAVNNIENELEIPTLSKAELTEKDLLHWVDDSVDAAYLQAIKEMSKLPGEEQQREKQFPIVFSPLHGTARELVPQGLQQLNFTDVHVVEEQAVPDPNFSTVQTPNPEETAAFEKAIQLGKSVKAELLLATDPDADRLGIAVRKNDGDYQLLTGNQLGVLLLDYVLRTENQTDLSKGRLLKTIVTTELGDKIAAAYGVKTVNTLTGFKFISEKIRSYDQTGEQFIFGFEESYGYLIESFARDKDAVQAAVLTAEMAYYWSTKNKTLLQALDGLYKEHGYYLEGISEITLEGLQGAEQIELIMATMRENPPIEIADKQVLYIEDYQKGLRRNLQSGSEAKINLPEENVLKYILPNNEWVCLRPSGTEPKIKCYFGVCTSTSEESEQRLSILQETMDQLMNEIIQ